MKNLVLTCLGLVGLSAAGGAALFAGHAALAAGPKLPDHVVRAHAVAASRAVVATPAVVDLSQASPVELAIQRHGAAVDFVEVEAEGAMPFVSSQNFDGLAPYRVLRPMARPDAYTAVAQASVAAPKPRAVVSQNRTAPALAPQRTVRRAPVMQPTYRTEPVAQRTGRIDPGYLHGVFR
ncbi:hypothetical protein [Sagittula sp. S175]|uniref:hypothetical protein n=1 Tax=Sagittula sp. S175 TaxID=3415129 RepID=UPI003C7A276F